MLLKEVEGGDCLLNDHVNSIVDHGKVTEISWIFFLNVCGNHVPASRYWISTLPGSALRTLVESPF